MTENKNAVVKSATELTKTQEEDILKKGSMDLSDFFDNFQYLCFVLDGSGSMSTRIDQDSSMRKVDLEKKVIEKYVNDKIGEKALTMKIGVVEFGSTAEIRLKGSSDLEEIKTGIRNISGHLGGTNASKGIRGALTLLKKNKDYTPRIVLTSDGQLGDEVMSLDAARQAKKAGVVIDTIFIGRGDNYSHLYSDTLKQLSDITGGVHEEITGEGDFEQKFLKVAERPLLTAGN